MLLAHLLCGRDTSIVNLLRWPAPISIFASFFHYFTHLTDEEHACLLHNLSSCSLKVIIAVPDNAGHGFSTELGFAIMCRGSTLQLPKGQAGRSADQGHQVELHQVSCGPRGQCGQKVRLRLVDAHDNTHTVAILRNDIFVSSPLLLAIESASWCTSVL